MQSDWVVEPIDVVDDGSGGLFVGLVFVPVDFLDLEASEETFHRRVVVAVPFAAHALQEVTGGQTVLISETCELRSPITVDDESLWWVS